MAPRFDKWTDSLKRAHPDISPSVEKLYGFINKWQKKARADRCRNAQEQRLAVALISAMVVYGQNLVRPIIPHIGSDNAPKSDIAPSFKDKPFLADRNDGDLEKDIAYWQDRENGEAVVAAIASCRSHFMQPTKAADRVTEEVANWRARGKR